MAITAKSVYRDTKHFFCTNFVNILLIAVLCAVFTVLLVYLLTYLFAPSAEQLASLTDALQKATESSPTSFTELVQNITNEQQNLLLRATSAVVFPILLGNMLMTGSLLMLVKRISDGQPINALTALGSSLPLLPRLFFLLFFISLFVNLGFMLYVLPGLFLSVLLALAPVIMVQDRAGIFTSLGRSAQLVMRNIWQVTPAVLVWLLLIRLLRATFQLTLYNQQVVSLLFNIGLVNILTAGLLIYLFRLYSLLR